MHPLLKKILDLPLVYKEYVSFRNGYVARLGQLDKHRSSERKADGSSPIGPKVLRRN